MAVMNTRRMRDADGVEWTVSETERGPAPGVVSDSTITLCATAGRQSVSLAALDSWTDLPSEVLLERLWEAAGIVSELKAELPKAYHLWFTFRGERYGLRPNAESRRTGSNGRFDAPGWVIHGKAGPVDLLPGELEDFDDLELLRGRVEACLLIREGHALHERFDAVCREVALAALEQGESVELHPEAETLTLRTPGLVSGSYFSVRVPPHCLLNASPADNAKTFLETYRRHHL